MTWFNVTGPAAAVPSEKHTDVLFSSYVTGRARQHHISATGTRHHHSMVHIKWHLSPFRSYINLLGLFHHLRDIILTSTHHYITVFLDSFEDLSNATMSPELVCYLLFLPLVSTAEFE